MEMMNPSRCEFCSVSGDQTSICYHEGPSDQVPKESSTTESDDKQKGLLVKVYRVQLVHTPNDEADGGEDETRQPSDLSGDETRATPVDELDDETATSKKASTNCQSAKHGVLINKAVNTEVSSKSSRYLRASRTKKYSHEYLVIKYSDLEDEQPAKAKGVLDYFHEMGSVRYVHLCGLFLTGKCNYMSNNSFNTLEHMRRNHRREKKLSAVKIIQYPGNRATSRPKENSCKPQYSYMKFGDLERISRAKAEAVFDYYNSIEKKGSIHLCSLFLVGECSYMSYSGANALGHIRNKHPKMKGLSAIKIIQYPDEYRQGYEYVTRNYCDLEKSNHLFAQNVLAYYNAPRNHKKYKVHVCGLALTGECDYFNFAGRHVRLHTKAQHPGEKDIAVIKIINYPGVKNKIFHQYQLITYLELKAKVPNLAPRILNFYNERCNKLKKRNVHICGLYLTGHCDHIADSGYEILRHLKYHHQGTNVQVYKIINYPSE